MSQTVDIGAARVRLIVDAEDFDAVIAQGKNAVRGFGQEAQQAYDRTEKATRRAADSLLDYVNSLGRADSSMDRYVRNASRLGVEKPVIDAAVAAWQRHNDEVDLSAQALADQSAHIKKVQAAYKELITVQQQQEQQQRANADAAARARVEEGSAQFARNAQERFNNQLGITESDPRASAQRRADAEAAFLPLIEKENSLLQQQKLLVETIATARAQQVASSAQQDFNSLLGIQDSLAASAQRRADAEAAFLPLIQAENDALQRQKLLADTIAAARAQNAMEQAQAQINARFGIEDAADPRASAQRRADAEAAFLPLIQAENDALEKQKILADTIATARAQQFASSAQQDFNKLLGIDAQEDALALQRRRADAQAAFLPLIEQEAKAERELQQQRANAESYIKQLQNTELAAGKSYYELLRLKAAELGVADAAEPFIKRIQATNEAMGRGTISAKQYSLAVRQLPAQFTDVFTSLVAGQNPLLVLLQQGGQVKDMFGGVKAAIGAVAKESALLLTNPYILLAAAIATVGVAAYQADTRITALAVSAAKGNGLAGTARELSRYAEQLNGLNNINLSGADAAVSKLAEGGRLAGNNFRLAAEASARWASVTGEAVDDVAGKFEAIARDPMAAILDGTVKITSAQYDQIRALLELGEQQKAVTELVRLYYEQINNNSQTVVTNLSEVAKKWREIKDEVTSAWHGTQSYFEYLLGAGLKAQERFNKLPWLVQMAPGSGILATLRGLADQSAGERVGTEKGRRASTTPAAESVSLNRQQIAANENLWKAWDNSGSKAERLSTKVQKLNADLRNATNEMLRNIQVTRNPDGTFSGKGYDRLVKSLSDKTKEPGGSRQGPDPTKAIQEREKTALADLRRMQQEFDYVYADRVSTIEAYYAKSLFLAREEADVQIKSNNDQIAALTGRKDSEDKIAALRQQNATVEQEFAARKAKLDREEVLATRQRTAALRDYQQALIDSNSQLKQNFAQAARAVGRGGRNPERLNALDNAQIDTNSAIRGIDNKLADGSISAEDAAKQKQAQYEALAEKQRLIAQGYEGIRLAEADWLSGGVKAWEDWLLQVSNIAQQIGSITTSAIGGMVDVISSKIRTGSSGFKGYLDNLNKMILDFIIKQQLSKFFEGLGGGGGAKTNTSLADLGSLFSASWGSAQGNVFGGGVLAGYRNSIVSQPTMFPFAKGGVPNVGLMGERSGKPHEAVIPLTRTPGGDLGVKMVGQNQQKVTNISQVFNVPGVPDRTSRDQLAIKMLGGAQRAARRS